VRPEQIRLLIFSIFLLVLIVFGLIYQPVDAVSRPADRGKNIVQVEAPPSTAKPVDQKQ